jgi:hypothetical protein
MIASIPSWTYLSHAWRSLGAHSKVIGVVLERLEFLRP